MSVCNAESCCCQRKRPQHLCRWWTPAVLTKHWTSRCLTNPAERWGFTCFLFAGWFLLVKVFVFKWQWIQGHSLVSEVFALWNDQIQSGHLLSEESRSPGHVFDSPTTTFKVIVAFYFGRTFPLVMLLVHFTCTLFMVIDYCRRLYYKISHLLSAVI